MEFPRFKVRDIQICSSKSKVIEILEFTKRIHIWLWSTGYTNVKETLPLGSHNWSIGDYIGDRIGPSNGVFHTLNRRSQHIGGVSDYRGIGQTSGFKKQSGPLKGPHIRTWPNK